MADDLFRSSNSSGPGLTSQTDHLMYLVFHGWAESFSKSVAGKDEDSAYTRLVWQHAWANYPARLKKKFVLYGLRTLAGLPIKKPKPAGWETGISSLVVLGPRERYARLWDSLPEKIKARAPEKYLSGFQNTRATLTKIARGNTPSLLRESRINKVLSLDGSRLHLFRELAACLANQPLPKSGLGHNLHSGYLKDTLFSVAAASHLPSPDTWTHDFLYKHPQPAQHTKRRLYRAALGRALVFAATRSLYDWAFHKLKEDVPTKPNHLHQIDPYKLIQRVKGLLQNQPDDKAALIEVDGHCADSGTPLKLAQLLSGINSREDLTEYAKECARKAGKGYVSGYGSSMVVGDKDLFNSFSGNYAGSLRLQQAWRFGRDLKVSLENRNAC